MITLKDISKKFQLKLVAGGKENLNKEVKIPGFNRAGLELSGFFIEDTLRRIITLGNKEYMYIKSLDHETKMKRYHDLMQNKEIPCIIITKRFLDKKDLIKVANDLDFPVLQTSKGVSDTWRELGEYLSDELAESEVLHASLANIFGQGVLIMGKSGVGKSEAMMDLVKKGHLFIGDDAIAVHRIGSYLMGRADDAVGTFLEVRGLGILNVKQMFGVQKVMHTSKVDIMIELTIPTVHEEYERVGVNSNTHEIMGVDLAYYKLPIKAGRNAADLIESAVVDFKMRKDGYISGKEFIEYSKKIHQEKEG